MILANGCNITKSEKFKGVWIISVPIVYIYIQYIYYRQPYHPAAQDWLPGKTRLLLEEVLVRPAGGAHPVVCVGPNAPV